MEHAKKEAADRGSERRQQEASRRLQQIQSPWTQTWSEEGDTPLPAGVEANGAM